jgi:hypothetical protein
MGRRTKPIKESFSETEDRWRASAREEDPSGRPELKINEVGFAFF